MDAEPEAVVVEPEPEPAPVPEPEPAPVPEPEPAPVPEPEPVPEPIPAPDPEPEPPAPDPAPVPRVAAPTATELAEPVAVRRAIEAEPDESSRSRGRLVRFVAGAVAAFISLVVLVAVVIGGSTTKVGTPTRPPQATTQTTVTPGTTQPFVAAQPLSLPAVLLKSGLVVERTWRLTGENGDRFIASIDVRNPTGKELSDSVIEVIPKVLVTSVTDVKFFGGTPAIINPDPIVRFDVKIAPGRRVRIGYQVSVPADGVDQNRLLVWKTGRDAEQSALDVLLTSPLPAKGLKP